MLYHHHLETSKKEKNNNSNEKGANKNLISKMFDKEWGI